MVDEKHEPALGRDQQEKKEGCTYGKTDQLVRRHDFPLFVSHGQERGYFVCVRVTPPNFQLPPARFIEMVSNVPAPSGFMR
jgi:hypothetical protein